MFMFGFVLFFALEAQVILGICKKVKHWLNEWFLHVFTSMIMGFNYSWFLLRNVIPPSYDRNIYHIAEEL